MEYKQIIAAIISMLCTSLLFAQDDEQSSERIDPAIEVSNNAEIDYSKYSFLQIEKNTISLNGSDWSGVSRRYRAAEDGDTTFTVVYLGDSHIQADFGGAVLRERLADAVGSAGRGLIIPFKMAGTNQPIDYNITTDSPIKSSRLLKQPWTVDMMFTGIAIEPQGSDLRLDVNCGEPFDRIRLLYGGTKPAVSGITSNGQEVRYINEADGTIYLDEPVTQVKLRLATQSDFVMGGMVLSKADAGTFVHSIGNNGATYATYNMISKLGDGIRELSPDLIIVALGTNEAFGTLDTQVMRKQVDTLVTGLQRANPQSAVLLVTPSECLRKRYRWRRGRRRVVGTTVNTKIKTARDVIREYAQSHNVALYDAYSVFGGAGAASKMKAAHVLGADGVHFTSEGYRLQGSLIADAILAQVAGDVEYRKPTQEITAE